MKYVKTTTILRCSDQYNDQAGGLLRLSPENGLYIEVFFIFYEIEYYQELIFHRLVMWKYYALHISKHLFVWKFKFFTLPFKKKLLLMWMFSKIILNDIDMRGSTDWSTQKGSRRWKKSSAYIFHCYHFNLDVKMTAWIKAFRIPIWPHLKPFA